MKAAEDSVEKDNEFKYSADWLWEVALHFGRRIGEYDGLKHAASSPDVAVASTSKERTSNESLCTSSDMCLHDKLANLSVADVSQADSRR